MQKTALPAEALCLSVSLERPCPDMPPGVRLRRHTINQTVLVMKLTIVLLTAAILNVHARGHAQQITFTGTNVELLKLFAVIETQTGYLAVGSEDMLKQTSKISVDVKNMPLDHFLKLILKDQPLDCRISGKTILLFRKAGTTSAVRIPPDARDALPQILLPINVKGIVVGISGIPLQGASIAIEGDKGYVLSDKEGKFELSAEKGQTLVISYVGYQPSRWKVTGAEARIEMMPIEKTMEDVEVVINTGYQKIKANEMVGSVEVITEKMLQQQVGTNILQRLKGLSTALMFENKVTSSSASGNPRSVLNMTIRGWSTINGPTDPLIIMDNFPYQGDIDNIDPNDVESIVLLKDAAATSIWGARAGNGVIVINTKRGKFNSKTAVNFRSTISVTEKPDLYKLPLMSTASVIDLELATHIDYKSPFARDALTPVMEVLHNRYMGFISAEDSAARINYLKGIDSRQQWDKYIYRHALTQQYSLNVSGGSNNISWLLSGSFAKITGRVQDKNDRATLTFSNNFKISRKLEMELGVSYTNSSSRSGAPEFNSITAANPVSEVYIPYLQLADEAGNPVPLLKKYRKSVIDTVAEGRLLDYNLYPLTDWKHDYSTGKLNNYILNGRLSYKPVNELQLSVSFQTQRQMAEDRNTKDKESYFTRTTVNAFTQFNPETKVLTRPLPLGDIVSLKNTNTNSLDLRAQAMYNKRFGKHHINLMAGLDLSEYTRSSEGQMLIGYGNDPLTHTIIDLVNLYPVQLEFPASIGSKLGVQGVYGITSLNERFISTTVSASYACNNKYVVYSSLRRDGANMLGVKANDRWKPLWSTGFNWMIDKEKFFQIKWINSLSLRTTIGVSGNVDVTKTSKPIGTINSSGNTNPAYPFPYLTIFDPPNPDLRWEKTKQINWALDFSVLNRRISATVEYYIKQSRDLYSSILADYTQSPSTSVKANAASMDGSGYDVRITTKNLVGDFNWTSIFNFSKNTNKIKQHYNQLVQSLYSKAGSDGLGLAESTPLFPGQSLFGLSAVRSAGLTNTGVWQFLVDGKVTTDFTLVNADFEKNGSKASAYVYYGQSTPAFFGSLINEFSWRQFSLSVLMQYKFGYYFKKTTFDPNFYINGSYHKDWESRWKKPGDELTTTIPKDNFFYYSAYSSDLVRKGDHIRILNMQLNYVVPLKTTVKAVKSLQLAVNVTNVGILWSANKEHLDPDYEASSRGYVQYNRPDRMWSLTLAAGF